MPIKLDNKDTLTAVRNESLQRSAQISTPLRVKSKALAQQLASAAELQLRPSTFAPARALYENALDQISKDPRLERGFAQRKVPLSPLNNSTPLEWSIDRGDVDSAALLADGPAQLLGKLDLSRPRHRAILEPVLAAMEADSLAASLGISSSEAADTLSGTQGAEALSTESQRAEAYASVAGFINTVRSNGLTLLHHEAARGRADTVHTLLRWGADIDRPSRDGHTALALLLRQGPADTEGVLRELIAAGASLDVNDMDGTPLLLLALQNAPLDAVACVLENLDGFASPELTDIAARWFASQATKGFTLRIAQAAELFLARGFDIKKCRQDDGGNLFVAVALSTVGSASLLQSALGALPEVSRGVRLQLANQALRFVAQSTWTETELAVLKIAVRFGMDPSLRIVERINYYDVQRDLMSAAALRGDLELVKILVDAKTPIDNPDSKGITPLGHAARRRCRPIYDFLLQCGAQDRTTMFCRSHWESPPTV